MYILDLTADFFFIRSNIYMYVRTIIIYRDCCTGRPGGLLLVVSHVVVLVREFESRLREVLTLFTTKKNKKDQQLLTAPISVGKHNSTRVDEGRKS